MTDCCMCKYAVLDYEEYYGTTEKEWFVTGCKKGLDKSENCPEYKEIQDDE